MYYETASVSSCNPRKLQGAGPLADNPCKLRETPFEASRPIDHGLSLNEAVVSYVKSKPEKVCSEFFTVVTCRRRKIFTFPESRIFLRQASRQTPEKYPFRIDDLILLKEDALKSTSYQV
ncbi:MAG: hypothetical protein C4522_10265 [Desulfobacteraceae bacterium]|nr:MAG: hypothetical protein C4522_10265 [Desulfobacteraceae bacterium]